MPDLALALLRLLTLLVLIGSYVWRDRVLHRVTQHWDALGRAVRTENRVYLAMWLWFLVLPLGGWLRHDGIVVAIELALIATALRVSWLLPRAGIEHRANPDPPVR